LRDEIKLRVFKNRMLRNLLRPKREDLTEEWIIMYNEELYALYSSPNIFWVIKSTQIRRVGHVENTGDRRGAYRVFGGERPFGRPRRLWEDNTEINIHKVGSGTWNGLIRLRTRIGGVFLLLR